MRFPLDPNGHPLLLDPTKVDPWAHLILDTANGMLSPRFLDDDYDQIGETTLEILSCVNFEAVTEGRLRVIRRYYEAIDRILSSPGHLPEFRDIAREIREDDFGISAWFALHEGARENVIAEMSKRFPVLWRRFIRMAASN